MAGVPTSYLDVFLAPVKKRKLRNCLDGETTKQGSNENGDIINQERRELENHRRRLTYQQKKTNDPQFYEKRKVYRDSRKNEDNKRRRIKREENKDLINKRRRELYKEQKKQVTLNANLCDIERKRRSSKYSKVYYQKNKTHLLRKQKHYREKIKGLQADDFVMLKNSSVQLIDVFMKEAKKIVPTV